MRFPELKNDRILRAARGDAVDKVPVWVMRQAGRYLPEFREISAKYDFFTICQTPELAAEVALQPIRRFDLDAAILFSDILVIPKALGMTVVKETGSSPVIMNPLKKPCDIDSLKTPIDITSTLKYVFKTIALTRHKLEGKVPLIGFAGAPFTLMTYMIEGQRSKTLSKAKTWLYHYPKDSKRLLSILTDAVVDFLTEQVAAGAQMIQVFETGSEYLTPYLFRDFAFPYLIDICKRIKENIKDHKIKDVPIAIYAKGAHYDLDKLTNSCYDVVGLDWTIDIQFARYIANYRTTLQGNLDPCALYAPKEQIPKLTQDMMTKFRKGYYIASLGHGVYPDTNPDHLKAFVDAVHDTRMVDYT